MPEATRTLSVTALVRKNPRVGLGLWKRLEPRAQASSSGNFTELASASVIIFSARASKLRSHYQQQQHQADLLRQPALAINSYLTSLTHPLTFLLSVLSFLYFFIISHHGESSSVSSSSPASGHHPCRLLVRHLGPHIIMGIGE